MIHRRSIVRYKIVCKCVSHIGNLRTLNQDNYILDRGYMASPAPGSEFPEQGARAFAPPFVAGVFDGMGGEECGEIASMLAAKHAAGIALSKEPVEDLLQFCRSANEEICRYSELHEISSMGTTAAMLAFTEKEIALCNIGDSKVFRITKRKIEQLSVDHCAASSFGSKPSIFQYLGIPSNESRIEPYVARGRYGKGDIYLICSDGLTDMVDRERIRSIVYGSAIDKAVEELLNAALESGGKDNITIILCQIVSNKKNGVF